MDTLTEKREAATAAQVRRAKDLERMCQNAAVMFSTDEGRELLTYLATRFDVLGRTFLSTDRGEVNAIRAGIRDGERAVVAHLFHLIRKAKPDFPLPL